MRSAVVFKSAIRSGQFNWNSPLLSAGISTRVKAMTRKMPTPSRPNDPFLPIQIPNGLKVVSPSSFVPHVVESSKQVVPARGDMTAEKFLKIIGRGVEEQAGKLGTWEELMSSTGETLKEKGIPVAQRRWILLWLEHYRQGREPQSLPLVSRAKKNKFLSKKKPKTIAQKKRD